MSIAVAAVVVLLIGAALVYVFRPLLRAEEFAAAEQALSPAEQLARARAAVARAIRDLDLDFGTGKLAEADYRHQRDQLERRAVELRRAEDAEEALLSAEIEREVTALRTSASRERAPRAGPPPRVGEGPGEGSADRSQRASRPAPAPERGKGSEIRDQGPGAKSQPRPQPSRCPWCDQPLQRDDDICPRCGQSVREALV